MGFGVHADSIVYHKIAYNITNGNGFSASGDEAFGYENYNGEYTPSAIRGPLYPLFLSLIYSTSNNQNVPEDFTSDWHQVRLWQAFLDALICFLVFFIVKILYKKKNWPAILSSILYASSTPNSLETS